MSRRDGRGEVVISSKSDFIWVFSSIPVNLDAHVISSWPYSPQQSLLPYEECLAALGEKFPACTESSKEVISMSHGIVR
jgi:hypothetical protein